LIQVNFVTLLRCAKSNLIEEGLNQERGGSDEDQGRELFLMFDDAAHIFEARQ
jgi:hypothetical protein